LQVSDLPLRRPLYDPPPPPPLVPVVPPMTVRLRGIIQEPGHSLAVFVKPDGSTKLCAVGQGIKDAGGQVTVTKIEPQAVTVQYAGQEQRLVPPATSREAGQP